MQTGFWIAAVPYALIGLAGWRSHRGFRRREAVAANAPRSIGEAGGASAAGGPSPAEAAPARRAFVLGKTPLAVERLQVQAVLDDALRVLDAEAACGLTRLTVAVAPKLTLRADPAALAQVLDDVVGGAIRRSPHGGVLVCAAPHGGRVQVSVADEGAGTGAQALAELSEATRGIVALHGGTLEAQDHPGGATVVLRLPVPPEQPRKPAASPGQTEAAPVGAAARPVAAPGWTPLATAAE